jgi:hypothetical protein
LEIGLGTHQRRAAKKWVADYFVGKPLVVVVVKAVPKPKFPVPTVSLVSL